MLASAILLIWSEGVVSDELPETTDATNECQVHGLNHSYPPFTCLDEDIKNMEVRSILSKYLEQILLEIKTNMELWDLSPLELLITMRIPHSDEFVNRCGLRACSNNSCHKLVSGQWVEQFVSSLHMPRRRHQEHGSLARSIQMLGTNTVENKNQHGALRPPCTRSTTLTWTRSSMPTKECPRPGRSRWQRRCIQVEYPGKDHVGHPATGRAILATTCHLHKGLGWSQFHALPHHQELHLVAGPVAYRSPRHRVHLAGATVPHLPTNTASAHTFLSHGRIAVPQGGTWPRSPWWWHLQSLPCPTCRRSPCPPQRPAALPNGQGSPPRLPNTPSSRACSCCYTHGYPTVWTPGSSKETVAQGLFLHLLIVPLRFHMSVTGSS